MTEKKNKTLKHRDLVLKSAKKTAAGPLKPSPSHRSFTLFGCSVGILNPYSRHEIILKWVHYKIIFAELLAIYHGLMLAWNRGFSKLIVETDSREAIALLFPGRCASHRYHQLINSILDIGGNNIDVKWIVVGRQSNAVADRLSKESHIIGGNAVIYDNIPGFLVTLFAPDGYGPAGPILMN